MKSLNMLLSFLLLAVICQAGGQTSSDDNDGHHRMQRDNFFVFKNTQNGLLATWDQTQSREKCQDKHPSCPAWGHQGECHRNPNYMVPNCAYTCNTCLIGLSNNNGIRGNNNAQRGCGNNAQGECDTVTRENLTRLRNGINREALNVLSSTVNTVNVSATIAANTTQGALGGKENSMLAAEAVASSAFEYANGCRDLHAVCRTLAAQGNCSSNSAFMFVKCPKSCNSCLPKDASECVNKGEDNSCELSAILGLCEVNYSYNLRFCSKSCRMTQSLKHRCARKRVFSSSSCPGLRSLRDFDCGVPLNRQKRLAVSMPPAQPRQPRRLSKPRTSNRKKNNKRERKRKQNKNINISNERGRDTGNTSILNTNMGDGNASGSTRVTENENIKHPGIGDIEGKQNFNGIDKNITTLDLSDSFTQFDAVCCAKLPNSSLIPLAGQEVCVGSNCPSVCFTNFNCTCCHYEGPSPFLLAYLVGTTIAFSTLLPSAGSAPIASSGGLRSPMTQGIRNALNRPLDPSRILGAAPVFPFAPLVPLITAPVIQALPPMRALSDLIIPDTDASRNAARSLLPFCDANKYLALVKQLIAITSKNTGQELDSQVLDITRAITHCRHGVGQLPPPLAANITTETGFGNISYTELTPPPNYPGISYPGIAAVGFNGTMTNNDRNRFFCGASLITNKHVLTAAHCLVNEGSKPEVIRLGESDFAAMDDRRAADYNVKKITLHPEYNILSNFNDIAIIELDKEVTLENLLPYCLPKMERNLDGLTCTFSGWGIRPNAPVSTLLVDVNVTVKSLEECKKQYRLAPEVFRLTHPRDLDESMLCAEGVDGEDACRGDSGGPLVLHSEESNKAEEVGIVSQAIGCGHPDFPGIYTRTDAFLEWIDEVVYQDDNEMICP